jgi:hypothetical protein
MCSRRIIPFPVNPARAVNILTPVCCRRCFVVETKGVRPLCCGDSIRRLVAKCFCLGGKYQISKEFNGKNYGFRGGVEAVGHSLRDVLAKHKSSDLALLKIDFKNAFNQMERDTFVTAACSRFAALERWTRWCYSRPPLLIYDHSRQFWSWTGVQQGDPLGPLYFCCGLQDLVDEIASLNPAYQKWYMDDGGIVGPVDLLLKVWDILSTKGPRIGLILNPAKCEWSWLNPDRTDACPIAGVPLVETSKIQMLGVPLGSSNFVYSHVEQELLPSAVKVMEKLARFEDSQIAMYLLRLSYGIVRANHFMRTTPLFQWLDHAKKFDELVCDTTEKILRTPLTKAAYDQACVSSRSGGFGIRKVEDHAPVAFNASWLSCRTLCNEVWDKPYDGIPDEAPKQRGGSVELDNVTMSRLAEAAAPREKQRLRRLNCEHANSWITAMPSDTDGKDTILPPNIFRTAVSRLLGLAVYAKPIPCPLCQQTMDVLGDHALCCKKTQDTVTRHNRVRNLVFKLDLEKQGILGHTEESKRRPGDVSIPVWKQNRSLY